MTATTLHSLHYSTTTTPLRYNYNYSCSTSHYIQQLWVRWPLQPLQPLQQTQLQPPFGQSVDSLCHPWFTTTKVSYRFPILKLPPPPCAVLLVYYSYIHLQQWKYYITIAIIMHVIHYFLQSKSTCFFLGFQRWFEPAEVYPLDKSECGSPVGGLPTSDVKKGANSRKPCVYPNLNGNFRILKWRYVSTMFLPKFCVDIPWNLGLIHGRYLQFCFLKWPLKSSYCGWACEILHQLTGGKHPTIWDGFQPSFWWCRISQPSTVWKFP